MVFSGSRIHLRVFSVPLLNYCTNIWMSCITGQGGTFADLACVESGGRAMSKIIFRWFGFFDRCLFFFMRGGCKAPRKHLTFIAGVPPRPHRTLRFLKLRHRVVRLLGLLFVRIFGLMCLPHDVEAWTAISCIPSVPLCFFACFCSFAPCRLGFSGSPSTFS